jgi:hypothetical protein
VSSSANDVGRYIVIRKLLSSIFNILNILLYTYQTSGLRGLEVAFPSHDPE